MNETNHPARRLRHGDRPTEPLTFEDAAANKAAEEGEQFVAMAARIFDFKPHKQQPEHKAKYVQFALEAIAADRVARPVDVKNALLEAKAIAEKWGSDDAADEIAELIAAVSDKESK